MIKILLILIIIILIINIFSKEHFNVQTGVKRGFNYVYNPYPLCLSNNNCFPGYYFRSWINTICK